MNKFKKITGAIIVIVVLLILFYLFDFLYSIRFKVHYLFHFSIDTHDYTDFDDNEKDFEKLIGYIDSIVKSDPAFFEKYESKCYAKEEGIIFFEKTIDGNGDKKLFPIQSPDWKQTRKCLYTFPEPGFQEIYFDLRYPDYIFFKNSEMTSRFFIYTRDKRPSRELLDEYWDKYEFVKVIKLSKGWYDIRPIGKK